MYHFFCCFSVSYKNFVFVCLLISSPVDFFRFSKKKYCGNIPSLNIESYFITKTDSLEVFNINDILHLDQSDGPNSISTRILKPLNKDISDQLAILFNQSFSSGIFPSIWKTSKVIPVYKNVRN